MRFRGGAGARVAAPLRLRAGEPVEVRPADEILATLDENGRLDGLPFMPEMLPYCGRRLRVAKRAHKTCDTINWTGIHRMEGAVHLEGTRCDGSAHGGCQARCLFYWKEAWLRRVTDDRRARRRPPPGPASVGDGTSCSMERLWESVWADPDGGTVRYSCQTTELIRAAPRRVPWWSPGQYVEDVTSCNVRPWTIVRSLALMLFNKFQKANRTFVPRVPLFRGAADYPFIQGTLDKTPRSHQRIATGDMVEIRRREEIVATLDRNNKNRGLAFESEMSRHCGTRRRVIDRVERIVDEATGEMVQLGSDCLMLEGATCSGFYRYLCPRATYAFWREIWVKPVSPEHNGSPQ